MLKSHMDACERHLLSSYQLPASSGHPLHKGTPREAFIKEFLQNHLPENLAIGTGEIIDASSKPGDTRNQLDLVLYRKSYPKLVFGGGVSGFMIESVVATVEVKSVLTEKELRKAVKTSNKLKNLVPSIITSFRAGYIPPTVLNYIVAYDGPSTMRTIYNWIGKAHLDFGLSSPSLPNNQPERTLIPAASIDAVFILGRGFVYFDNTPITLGNEMRETDPELKWVFADTPEGSLLIFFCFLNAACQNIEGRWINVLPYLSSLRMQGVAGGNERLPSQSTVLE